MTIVNSSTNGSSFVGSTPMKKSTFPTIDNASTTMNTNHNGTSFAAINGNTTKSISRINENIDHSTPQHLELFRDLLASTAWDIEEDQAEPFTPPVFTPSNGNGNSGLNKKVKFPKLRNKDYSSFSHALLWVPILLTISLIMTIELFFYVIVRQVVNIWEYMHTWRGYKLVLRNKLRNAPDYATWCKVARELDKHFGRDVWRKEASDPNYDWRLIKNLTNRLKKYRVKENNVQALVNTLAEGGVKGNCGGVENRRLYSMTYFGTKDIIEDYLDEVCSSLDYLTCADEITPAQKHEFFKLASKNYGRTALCLSGGASLGYYHLGVIKQLLELNILPQVITGSSAGSLIAAMVCVRTDEELKALLKVELGSRLKACDEPLAVLLHRFFSKGTVFDAFDFARKSQWVTLGSMTFREAYLRTGRALNISVVPLGTSQSPVKVLNYINAPDCIIWSAVLASSAIPGVLPPVVLLRKTPDGRAEPFLGKSSRWRDGSLKSDIPNEALKYYFNVRFTLVSQVNPHITLFFYSPRGTVGRPSSHLLGRGYRGGFIFAALEHALKLDLAKYLRILRDLELVPRPMNQDYSYLWLQRFHGSVTVWPRWDWGAVFRLFNDPDEKWMKIYLDEGGRSLWGKVRMMENRLRLERKIWGGRRHWAGVMKHVNPTNKDDDSFEKLAPKRLSMSSFVLESEDDDDADSSCE